jgi:hypothetical protein
LSLIVDNKSKSPIRNVGLAYLSHGEDFWANPIEIKEVKAKKQSVVDLSKKKIRIFQFKLKFFVDGEMRFFEEIPVPGGEHFYQCIGVDYTDDVSTLWFVTSPLD